MEIREKDSKIKTWLDLTDEELKKIADVSACMYGRKDKGTQ